jgi:hypothetical protein
MVNPGAFSGSRKIFLLSEKANYVASVKDNLCAEFILGLQRHYLKRYPILLDHNEEPSAEWFANMDDHAADQEDNLSDLSATQLEARHKLLIFRKEVCPLQLLHSSRI